jgi:hypothetical protein
MLRDAQLFRLRVRNLTSLDEPDRLHTDEITRRALALVADDELAATPINREELLALVDRSRSQNR